jgi:hypothetical protein
MIAEGPLPTTMAHRSCSSRALTGGFFSNGLPAASFLLALAWICQALKKTQGVLHLRVSELDRDALLRRNLRDHPLPLHAAVTRDARSVFLDGHLQSEEDGGFILVENGDDASASMTDSIPLSVYETSPVLRLIVHIRAVAICPARFSARC